MPLSCRVTVSDFPNDVLFSNYGCNPKECIVYFTEHMYLEIAFSVLPHVSHTKVSVIIRIISKRKNNLANIV